MSDEIHIGSVRKQMPSLKCPACGGAADGATAINDRPIATKVKPGDLSMCIYCGVFNCYEEAPSTPSGLILRTLTSEEWAEVRRDKRFSRLIDIGAKGRIP